MLQQRRSRRRTEFSVDAAAVNRYIPEDICGSRRRNRKYPVGTFHLTASHMNRRCDHPFRCQPVHQHTHRSDIRNGVHGSDFMKMYLLHRLSVDMALCLCDQTIDGKDVFLHLLTDPHLLHDLPDLRHPVSVMMPVAVMVLVVMVVIVMMVMMIMVVVMLMVMLMLVVVVMLMVMIHGPMRMLVVIMHLLTLLNSIDRHADVAATDPALLCRLTKEGHPGDTQGIQFRKERLPVRQELRQSSRQHIAGRTHSAIQI